MPLLVDPQEVVISTETHLGAAPRCCSSSTSSSTSPIDSSDGKSQRKWPQWGAGALLFLFLFLTHAHTHSLLRVTNQSVLLSRPPQQRSRRQIQYRRSVDFTSVSGGGVVGWGGWGSAATPPSQNNTNTLPSQKGHKMVIGILSGKLITATRSSRLRAAAARAIRCNFPLQAIFLFQVF